MSPPLVELEGIVKAHAGPRPLRVKHLRIEPGERYTLSGFDADAAEMFVHLITGAVLPDEGDVRIAGTSTRGITTDTAWLASLDRFGLVTARAVLIEKLTVADNLALPLTLSIDPIPDAVRPQVERLADEVEIARERLAAPTASLSPVERVRLHLARAIAPNPSLLLFEHSTAELEAASAAALGAALARIATARRLGWILLSDDERLTKAAGGTRLRLEANTGELARPRWWRRK